MVMEVLREIKQGNKVILSFNWNNLDWNEITVI